VQRANKKKRRTTMFSGIVESTGIIVNVLDENGCRLLTISPVRMFYDVAIGESIAVNGVCLTVTSFSDELFYVTAVPETLRLTNISQLKKGNMVNLERSILPTTRLGGHYVQGHVDGMGQILEVKQDNSHALLVKISIPEYLSQYIVKKGYITLDGMSITIIDTSDTWFTVTIIPHTQAVTAAQNYAVGTLVNIEVDMMGKYIEKLLGAYKHAHTN
jgi:riboflavin synthase